MQNLFIGGTGRSGTTILAKALACNPKFYTLKTELRFITDPDGIIDLKSALVDDWSFYRADFAIDRFKQLINKLGSKYFSNYPNSNLNEVVGKYYLNDWLNDFLKEFYYDYSKNNWAARATLFTKIITKVLKNPPLLNKFLPQSYYTSPLQNEEFFVIVRKHLEIFFSKVSELHNAEIVIDHTPSSIIHADFMKNLFKEFKLINIYRDPRDIIASYGTKDWGNSKFEYNVKWVFDILKKWNDIKSHLNSTEYIEVKFEDFVHNYEKTLVEIYDFINQPIPQSFSVIDLSKNNIGRWKKNLTDRQSNYILKNYSDYFKQYNFKS